MGWNVGTNVPRRVGRQRSQYALCLSYAMRSYRLHEHNFRAACYNQLFLAFGVESAVKVLVLTVAIFVDCQSSRCRTHVTQTPVPVEGNHAAFFQAVKTEFASAALSCNEALGRLPSLVSQIAPMQCRVRGFEYRVEQRKFAPVCRPWRFGVLNKSLLLPLTEQLQSLPLSKFALPLLAAENG